MRARLILSIALAALFGIALSSAPAHAQRALPQVLDLNRRGMEAYNNLEIEEAQSLLNQALQAAQRGGVLGAPLARTYVNLGVVAIGGMGDNGAGLEYLVQALQADPNVQLDPLTSTPDVQTMFSLAQQRARQGGGGTTTSPPPGGSTETTTSPSGGGSAAGDLTHVAVPEQLQQTAVPVFIEVPGSPAHVYLYYRSAGMRDFRRVEMERVGRGYGFEIPCSDVFSPDVQYYIVAFAQDGSPAGFAGSQASPVRVPIVQSRTHSAPSLPGRAAPTQCRESECPPGMSGCSGGGGGTAQLGDSCRTNSDCASNNCDDDLCGPSGGGSSGGSSEPGGGSAEESTAPAFFARVSAAAGLSYVENGMTTDRYPCSPGDAGATDGCTVIDDFPSVDPSWSSLSPEQRAQTPFYDRALELGYVPPGSPLCNPEGGFDGETLDPYCFYVLSPGLVGNFALRIDLGYYVLPFLAITAGTRIQPIAGQGTMAMLQVYGGVELQITPPTDLGFHLHAHVRGGGGQIQVFLPRGGNKDAPWGTSGLGMVDLGITAGYRFNRYVSLFLQPNFVFSVPQFLFTLDIGGGLEVSY